MPRKPDDDCGHDPGRVPGEVDYPCERCKQRKAGVMFAGDVRQYLCGECWAKLKPPGWAPGAGSH